MKKLLEEESEFVPVAAADSDEDDRKIEELTRMQYNTFRAILTNKRVHIKGVAGSGKTVIATWGANALADEGKKVLYLCYNNLLASWMNHQKSNKNKFEIHSFFSFCKKTVEAKGMIFQQKPDENDFYEKRAVDLTLDAIEKMSENEKYDAIFVDEAQDFQSDWWFVVESLLKDGADNHLYLFYDPKQGLYNYNSNFPEGVLCELTQNCRNTKKITNYCGQVIETEIDTFKFAPEGVSPEVLSALPELKSRASKVRNIVMKWIEEGYSPSRIAVVSPWSHSNDKNSIKDIDNVQGIPLINDEKTIGQWIEGKAVWAKTIKSFKGLEADCLIITDVPKVGTVGFKVEDLYVAASRAKSRLILLPMNTEAEQELKRILGQHFVQ
jgi:DNA helicase IV